MTSLAAWSLPMAAILGYVFIVTHSLGRTLLNPFDPIPASVPIDSITRTIEINLLQTIEEPDVPEPIKVIDNRLRDVMNLLVNIPRLFNIQWSGRCLLFLLVFCSVPALSQVHLGVYAGGNLNKFEGDLGSEARYTTSPGWEAGVDFSIHLSEDIIISLQPGYFVGGGNLAFLDNSKRFQDSLFINIDYASIPLILKVLSDNNKWMFTTGIEFAKPLSVIVNSDPLEEDLKDNINNTNFTANFGIARRWKLWQRHMALEARYTQGLSSLVHEPLVPNNSFLPRVKTSSFRLILSYEIF